MFSGRACDSHRVICVWFDLCDIIILWFRFVSVSQSSCVYWWIECNVWFTGIARGTTMNFLLWDMYDVEVLFAMDKYYSVKLYFIR